jgi:hypothetical protein
MLSIVAGTVEGPAQITTDSEERKSPLSGIACTCPSLNDQSLNLFVVGIRYVPLKD